MVGVEPTTYGLRNRCSTTELHWRSNGHRPCPSAPVLASLESAWKAGGCILPPLEGKPLERGSIDPQQRPKQ